METRSGDDDTLGSRTGCVEAQRGSVAVGDLRTDQFRHGHVPVLVNQFDQESTMGIKLDLAARTTLRRVSGVPLRRIARPIARPL